MIGFVFVAVSGARAVHPPLQRVHSPSVSVDLEVGVFERPGRQAVWGGGG